MCSEVTLPPLSSEYDFSVIVVSYNTKELTIACVNSIMATDKKLKIQIIVVDNCSSDSSSVALRATFPNITVIDSPHNSGFSFGNNIGLERASAPLIMFLNPDTTVPGDFFVRALAIMQAKPHTGMLGAKILNPSGKQAASIMRDMTLSQLALMIFVPAKYLRKTSALGDFRYASLDPGKPHDIENISGCAMLTRREVIEAVGGLDSRFFMYTEEMELCLRIRHAGWTISYDPSIAIMHVGGASTKGKSPLQVVEMARGQLLYFRLTRGPFAQWIAACLMMIRDFIRAPFYLIMALAFRRFRNNNVAAWWARLKFLFKSIFKPPKGQYVALPDNHR